MPYEENDGRGKDRPVLVVATEPAGTVLAVQLTSKAHTGDGEFVALGSGSLGCRGTGQLGQPGAGVPGASGRDAPGSNRAGRAGATDWSAPR